MWPESASHVQLRIPNGYLRTAGGRRGETSSSSSSSFCHVEYCPRDGGGSVNAKGGGTGGLLKVVTSDEARTVLDVMRVEDVVGASVEVTLRTEDETTKDDETKDLVRSVSAPSETLVDTQGCATLHVYCYPKVTTRPSILQRLGLSKSSGPPVPDKSPYLLASDDAEEINNSASSAAPLPRRAAHRAFVLAPVEDLSNVQILVHAILQLARNSDNSASSLSLSSRPPRDSYLVLINPISGQGHGERDARQTVIPMLEQAGIDTTVVVTQHHGHAYELCRDGHQNDSKDKSSMWDGITGIVVVGGDGVFHEVVNALSASGSLHRYKLGMVPCGTGSGLAATVAHANHEQCTVLSSTYTICKGHVMEADTSQYYTTNQSHASFLTYSWGLVADVDMESECIRWMGTSRLDLWAVYRILFLRTYRGTLSYTTRPVSSLPPLSDPVPDDWTVLKDEFILFWASQVSHASMGFHHSPLSKMGDGVFQIMIVRKPMSRFQMIRILLSIDSGEHGALRGVEFVTCTAYRLEPSGSFNVIDGEKVEPGPIQAHVVPHSLRVFGRDR